MILTLRTERIRTLDRLRAFLEGNEAADFQPTHRDSAYALVRRTLVRFEYHGPREAGQGPGEADIEKVTGFSRSLVTRLIRQHRWTGHIRDHRGESPRPTLSRAATPPTTRPSWPRLTRAVGQLSGPATKVILWRMYHVYGDARFERLAQISNGHIYNLRRTRAYRTGRLTLRETRSTPVGFGMRRKPRPDGRPGFLRVDTVHLGDLGGRKGAYVINVVDEVTQFQHLGAVPRITQQFMVPVLKDLISAFPFTVRAFHTDNGSEYVNREVADLLNHRRPIRSGDQVPVLERSRPDDPGQRVPEDVTTRPGPTATLPRPRPRTRPAATRGRILAPASWAVAAPGPAAFSDTCARAA